MISRIAPNDGQIVNLKCYGTRTFGDFSLTFFFVSLIVYSKLDKYYMRKRELWETEVDTPSQDRFIHNRIIRIRNAKWFFGSRVGVGGEKRSEGENESNWTAQRTCRSGWVHYFTWRQPFTGGPIVIVIHCYEWRNECSAQFPCIWRFLGKYKYLPNNKPTIFSLSSRQGLTLPRAYGVDCYGVLLVSLFSSFSSSAVLLIWSWRGIWRARWSWARNTDYRRRGSPSISSFFLSFLSFDNEANEGAICQPSPRAPLLKANNEMERQRKCCCCYRFGARISRRITWN